MNNDDLDEQLLNAIEEEQETEEKLIPVMKALTIISGIIVVICAFYLVSLYVKLS